MHDSLRVGSFECFGDLSRKGKRFVDRHRSRGDTIGEGESVHEFEHEGPGSVRFLEAMNRRDVVVIERRQDLRFPLESGEALRIGGDRGGEDFERDLAIQLRVTGTPNFAHAAGAKRADDLEGPDSDTCTECHVVKSGHHTADDR